MQTNVYVCVEGLEDENVAAVFYSHFIKRVNVRIRETNSCQSVVYCLTSN